MADTVVKDARDCKICQSKATFDKGKADLVVSDQGEGKLVCAECKTETNIGPVDQTFEEKIQTVANYAKVLVETFVHNHQGPAGREELKAQFQHFVGKFAGTH